MGFLSQGVRVKAPNSGAQAPWATLVSTCKACPRCESPDRLPQANLQGGEGERRAGPGQAQTACVEGKPEAGARNALWLFLLGTNHRILSRNGADLFIQ